MSELEFKNRIRTVLDKSYRAPSQSEEEELSFQPITEGLGFHPFEQGLPYATTQQPVAQVVSEMISIPVQNKPVLTESLEVVSEPEILVRRYSFWYCVKRLFAYGIDFSFSAVFFLTLFLSFLWEREVTPEWLLHQSSLIKLGVIFLNFHWLMMIAQECLFKNSLGKWVVRLSLHGSRKRIFFRAVLFVPSVLFFFWGLFHSKNRCLHDSWTNLQPEEELSE